ncbi:MAG TPA: ABC transporter substrate binding protein [Candidatus Methylomirabilis sp.]|nr:ABC transporter substrate binding protein [Candidatus Methylomirabilis sp.]
MLSGRRSWRGCGSAAISRARTSPSRAGTRRRGRSGPPAVYPLRSYVEAGGLMSYGYDQPHSFRRLGFYVDKIFNGARPADLPVEQPTKFDLVINLKAANALGLTIRQFLLSRAAEVIR